MKYSSLLLSCIIVLCVSVPNSFAAGTLIVSGPPKAPPVVWEEYKKTRGCWTGHCQIHSYRTNPVQEERQFTG
ncbi:MAG TPA: hypothetical protein EYH36_10275 [Desulfocapsa sulfexigens]|nr:hypothetical protein [Desulfocapsa sulfexigens]